MSQQNQLPEIVVKVGAISDNSGVYISNQNVILGISNHSKTNSGIGSIDSHNALLGNLSIVYDNDGIDTPIDDRDVKIYQSQPDASEKMTQIAFDSIQVLSISQNSGVFVGDVKITGLDSHAKQNLARGATSGNQNVEAKNVNYIEDADFVDGVIFDQDFKALIR